MTTPEPTSSAAPPASGDQSEVTWYTRLSVRLRTHALAVEERRVAVAATLSAMAVVISSIAGTGPVVLRDVVFSVVLAWIVFAGSHALMVWWVHHRLAGDALTECLLADRQSISRRAWWHDYLVGTSNRAMSNNIAGGALVAVLALVIYPELRRDVVLLGLAAALVAVSWLDLAIAHAVHYARLDQVRGGLDFPGDEPRSFADYHYFSTGVMSTFGATDVTVTTTEMRSVVKRHALLAFCFNSVIVALLVSLVLSLN